MYWVSRFHFTSRVCYKLVSSAILLSSPLILCKRPSASVVFLYLESPASNNITMSDKVVTIRKFMTNMLLSRKQFVSFPFPCSLFTNLNSFLANANICYDQWPYLCSLRYCSFETLFIWFFLLYNENLTSNFFVYHIAR